MKVEVIIVAAGKGARLGGKIPKALVPLRGRPLIEYSLKIFEQNRGIDGIIVVAAKDCLGRFQGLGRRFRKLRAVVEGGKTRGASVKRGLAAVDPSAALVLVHDAARPLLQQDIVDRLLKALRRGKAAIAAVPVKSTIKEVGAATLVRKTLRRDLLWEAQTPQGFDRVLLCRAHAQDFAGEATDDAALVEAMGAEVKIVQGSYRNIKITTPEDLRVAQALMG